MIYAPAASADFQTQFTAELERLASDVSEFLGDNLVALILGGGYGRGEGGVVNRDNRELPYNDLDLTIVVNEPSSVDQYRLEAIGMKASDAIGIEVDFSRPVAPCDIQNWPNTLMWHDLLNGHIVLAGESDILRRLAPPCLSEPVAPTEALRLLLNRGSGLLWALAITHGDEPSPDDDFVVRNAYKCLLSLGDAVLITNKKYNTQYKGRDAILDRLCADDPDIKALNIQDRYRAALIFKFTPDLAPALDTDIAGLRAVADAWMSVMLYVENSRYDRASWQTMSEYIAWNGIREPAQNAASRWPKNALHNGALGRLSLRYPREQLYRSLPALLISERDRPANWSNRVKDYLAIWKRFN